MNTADLFRKNNFHLLENILRKKVPAPTKKIFSVDAKDENFDKPLSSLNKDFTKSGSVVMVTRLKPVYE